MTTNCTSGCLIWTTFQPLCKFALMFSSRGRWIEFKFWKKTSGTTQIEILFKIVSKLNFNTQLFCREEVTVGYALAQFVLSHWTIKSIISWRTFIWESWEFSWSPDLLTMNFWDNSFSVASSSLLDNFSPSYAVVARETRRISDTGLIAACFPSNRCLYTLLVHCTTWRCNCSAKLQFIYRCTVASQKK